MTLDEIFIKHGTDKSSLNHNYSPHYELIFGPLKEKSMNILEIGVYEGASVRAWKEYFPNSNIFGADLQYYPQYNEDRLFMIEADATDDNDLNRLAEVPYDLIIEDASHKGIDQLKTFHRLFHSLKAGGIFVIEDLLCAYDSRWSDPINIMDLIKTLPGDVQMNGAVPGSHLCANKEKAVKLYGEGRTYFENHISWIHVGMGIIFIKKMEA